MHRIGKQKYYVFVKASSFADSALEAEAQALELAAQIGTAMGVHQPNFLTDSNVLAEAVVKKDPIKHPGHCSIRPNLHQILSYIQNLDARVIKIRRENNKIAHRQVQDAYKLHNVQA